MLATMGEGGPTYLQGIEDLFQGFQTLKRHFVLHNPRDTEARHLTQFSNSDIHTKANHVV
jgi:hypothetical protein